MSTKALQRTVRAKFAQLAHLPARLGLISLATCLLAFSAPAVDAATQGTGDPNTSTGTLDIDLVLGFRARISGLADMALGQWSGTGPMAANDNICVGGNYFGGGYRIRASGDGEPGDPAAFTLSNGASQIKYDAYFNDVANAGTGRVPLTGGVTLTGQTGSGLPRVFNYIFGCVINNANISIEVPEAELIGGGGTYNGTLTLLLLPE